MCRSCRRALPIKHGVCRLCWRHAEIQHPPRQPIDLLEANRHGQQLFLADLQQFAGARTAAAAPRHDTGRSPIDRRQLQLFDPARPIPHPRLAELEQAARDHAAAHGWSVSTRSRLLTGLRKVLTVHAADRQVAASAVVTLLAAGHTAQRHTLELLAAAGMLIEDRTPALEVWFERQLEGLPDPMVDELRVWFDVLYRGATTAPRSRPRSPTTIKTRLLWALPILQRWADQGHRSLREISRADIAAVLPPSGTPRATLGMALRSIFATLKARKMIFTNPMTRTAIGQIERRQPLPVDVDQLRAALASPDPARAVLTALIAFHGLRSGELRSLHLTDACDGRLHLDGRSIPLAEPVRRRLADYLDDRTARWPGSVNPHLFVTRQSALGTGPVGASWVWRTLDIPARTLRQDRILEEAIATGGDVRRLCDLFDITVHTAVHYAAIVAHPDLEDTDRVG